MSTVFKNTVQPLVSGELYQRPTQKIVVTLLCAALTGCGGSSGSSESISAVQNDQSPVMPDLVNNGPAGNSGLSIDELRYPLNVALGDIWGPENEHYRIDFTLSNGNFEVELQVIDGVEHTFLVPAQTTAVFHARLFNPGENFDVGTYAYAASVSDSSLSGVPYFTAAYAGVDTNVDDRVDDSEQFNVVDGLVQITGTLPDIIIEFSVTLSNGQFVSGNYSGLYDFTERF